MNRRTFLAALGGSVVVLTVPGWAQQKGFYRIGYLANDKDPRNASLTFKAFVSGLQERGWIEGRNIEIHIKSSAGRNEEFPRLADELVRERVDLIVTGGSPATRAARAATNSIPIVFGSAGNPVEQNFVASLARPGGNVTGLSLMVKELGPKKLQLLKELLPKATHLARIYQPGSIDKLTESEIRNECDAAARRLGVTMSHIAIARFEDVEPAFAAAARDRVDAGYVTAAGAFVGNRKEVAQLSLKHRLPLLGPDSRFANEGALLSYGEDFPARYRRAALIVDKILRGTRPADIPVEEPAIFELVVNLTTAKAMGITIPDSFMLQTNRTIR